MKKIYLLLFLSTVVSCNSEKTETTSLKLENKILKKELEIERLKDSISVVKSSDKSTISPDKTMESNKSTVINTLDYIKNFKSRYPHDVKLYQKGVLKSRLIKLLGNANYKKFIEYSDVQSPIEIVNDEYLFLNAGAPHSFGVFEAAILIDLKHNHITVGILDNENVLHFSENKNMSVQSNGDSKFQEWKYTAEKNATENRNF